MHVIISIDDQPGGEVSIKTLAHPCAPGEKARKTPATELGDFLQKAIEVWQHTRDMDLPQSHQFVQSLVRDPGKHH